MIEEIDLRAYIGILLRHWLLIVGLAGGAAIIGFTISSLQPIKYQASAMILVTQPRYEIQFDARLRTEDSAPMYRMFPRLVMSDEVLEGVVDALASSPETHTKEWSIEDLTEMIEIISEADPNLIVLRATARFAQDAAAIANLWADAFVEQGNRIFGEREDDLAFFEEQLEQAAQELNQADADLIEYQAHNQADMLSRELDSLRTAQAEYLARQRTITYLVQDIEGFREQLAKQPGDQPPSLADYLTALQLQVKAFNVQGSAPIELQLDSSESLADKSMAEQIAFLDDLMDMLQTKSAEIDDRMAELEPQTLAIQQEWHELTLEGDRLNRTRDLARETYLTLARKVDEAYIAAQEEDKMFQVGSYARVPRVPIGRQRLLKTAAAGALGLLVGVSAAFLIEFWRRDGRQASHEND